MVGGTKDINWDSCVALNPDLVVMDKEENTLPMAESCPFTWHATHITSLDSVGSELLVLAELLKSPELAALAAGWQSLTESNNLSLEVNSKLPGLIQTIGNQEIAFDRVEYMIWRNPWMAVSRETFIGSVLEKVGFDSYLPRHSKPYPELADSALPEPGTFYLFSSEPYPFERHVDELAELGFNGALVDGEFYSWFGSRSYRLLNQYLTEKR